MRRQKTRGREKVRQSVFCAGVSETHAVSWDACSEMVALCCEGGVFGPPVSEGHSFDTCASLVL